jgi:hypothetical protein
MGSHQFVVRAALVLLLGSLGPSTFAADNFRKLKDAEIRARLAGMETTDGVHWVEQYMRDGTYTAVHMGKPSKGKWFVRNGELCLDAGKAEADCREVWISGNKVEFRGTGFQGVLQTQRKRG